MATAATPSKDEFYNYQRSKKVVIAAEFDSHGCSPKIIDHESWELDYYLITKDALEREKILVKTMDGNLYSLTKLEKKNQIRSRFIAAPIIIIIIPGARETHT